MQETYIFSVCANNDKSILSRIAMLFTRRNIAFQSLTAQQSDGGEAYTYTIVTDTTDKWAEQINKELRKIIGVKSACCTHQAAAARLQEIYTKPQEVV